MQENEEVRGNEEPRDGEQTRRSRKINQKDILLVIYALLTVVAVVIAVYTIVMKIREPAEAKESAVEKLTDSIAFPQFEQIEFKADKVKQKISFFNPEENFVKFRVSIVLDDEVLWESELLQPGDRSEKVILTRPLTAGEYEARLVYHCFVDDEEQDPRNGADSPFILKVK